jgi:hypothetical protein
MPYPRLAHFFVVAYWMKFLAMMLISSQPLIKRKLRPIIKRLGHFCIEILLKTNQAISILIPFLGIPKIQSGLQNSKDEG